VAGCPTAGGAPRAGAARVGTARTGEAQLRVLVRGAPGLTVLTGGQTGVDTEAAVAALATGLNVQLVFPRGLRQEDGSLTTARRRQFRGAAIHELGSISFRYRTWTCAYLADVVLLLDPAGGSGCRETARAARKLGRSLLRPAGLDQPGAAVVYGWLEQADARVLMVAGCRRSVLARQPGADRAVRAALAEVMTGARAWHDRLSGGP
jgi:Circularly permutated YpsA SLOG family